MKKITHTYTERVQNPNLELIDFGLLSTNKLLYIAAITEKIWLDSVFRTEVKRKIKNDVIFKRKFKEYFPEIYDDILTNYEEKQDHLRK